MIGHVHLIKNMTHIQRITVMRIHIHIHFFPYLLTILCQAVRISFSSCSHLDLVLSP